MVLLVLVGIAALVLSFLPFGHALGFDWWEGAGVLGLSGGTALLQYFLQAWGMLLADAAAVLMGAALLVSLLVLGWRLAHKANAAGLSGIRLPWVKATPASPAAGNP